MQSWSFVAWGAMGYHMAGHMAKSHSQCLVWNRTKTKAEMQQMQQMQLTLILLAFLKILSILLSTCGVSNPGGPAAFPGVWLQCGGQAARLGIQSGWVGIAWQHVSEKIEWIALSQFNGFHPNCLTRKVLIFCLPTSEEDETIVEQASLFVSRFLGWHPGK